MPLCCDMGLDLPVIRVPWAFAASNSAIARVTQAATEKRVKFVTEALFALGLMACAFPNLARQVVEVLEVRVKRHHQLSRAA